MMKAVFYVAATASLLIAPSAALAGEITGPPPEGNIYDNERISNGASFCSYSGLNETPDGYGEPGDPDFDPGGPIQSYGYFMSHFDAFDPSDPVERSGFAFPGTGCNGHNINLHG